jgi:hypothetical protein
VKNVKTKKLMKTLDAFRDVTVYAHSEALALADLPIDDPVEGDRSITLDRVYLGLKPGRQVILSGERLDLAGVVASEAMILKTVRIEAGFTVLTFEQSLTYHYVRQTVRINCNVAPATHGETVQETLGGGDAGQSFQRFSLRQPPLTYFGTATPSGAQTTLEVRVNNILWHEVTSLLNHGPEERIYTTRVDDDGKNSVIFGDGKNPVNFISAVDVAKFIILALEDPRLHNQVVEIGGPENLTLDEIAGLYERLSGHKARRQHLPSGMIKVMSKALWPVQEGPARLMALAYLMTTTDQTLDMEDLLQRYPVNLRRMEEVAREKFAALQPSGGDEEPDAFVPPEFIPLRH